MVGNGTVSVYSHLFPGMAEQATERLSAALLGGWQ